MNTLSKRELTEKDVADHYGISELYERIFGALEKGGISQENLDVDSLAPMDEFHIRGRESTVELANRLELGPDVDVLDVGCGIGGTARHLAVSYGCRVTGIDLTPAYCELAEELSSRVGLGEETSFQRASALDLPFEDESFDVVWTEHTQMNIADKRRFYAEAARVLRPGGVLAFHDVFAGPESRLNYPMPWATTEDSSFLAPAPAIRKILEELSLSEVVWHDCSEISTAWFRSVREKISTSGPPAVGIHLLMGETAPLKVANAHEGLASGAMVTIQAVLRKAG